MRLLTFTFLPESNHSHSNKCFFLCLVPYIHICLHYFFIFCFYFHLLFLTLLTTRHTLQFTTFDSILLQPACIITEIKQHFMIQDKRKSVALIITKTNAIITFVTKYEFLLPLYQITFFLAF